MTFNGVKLYRSFKLTRLLLFALVCFLFVPLFAAFMPLFKNGAMANLKRALGDPRFMASFKYGLAQAGASTALALALGLPAAFLTAKRSFPGRRILASMAAVPFTVPPLIIAIAFVLFYGREGFLNRALMALFGLKEAPLSFLYSFKGVVLTHGFYNFPLVMSFVGHAWSTVPKKQENSATILGASDGRVFFTISLPSILPSIGAALSLVFLMCFYSFVIVLLFGAPGAQTPEVELYRAARFQFDMPLASAFALAETMVAMVCLALYAAFEKFAGSDRTEVEYSRPVPFESKWGAALAALYLLFILIFFASSLVSIFFESFIVRSSPGRTHSYSFGLANYLELFMRPGFAKALLNTLLLGLASAGLASIVGFVFSVTLKNSKSVFLSRVLPLLPLGVSSVVLAFGWSSLIDGFSVFALVAIHSFSSWPFVYRAIHSGLGKSARAYEKAAISLGSTSLGVIFRVYLPLSMPSIASGFALAFAMSAGDANAVIAAPGGGFSTLGLYIYRLAGAYRFNEACAVASILFIMSVLVFMLKEPSHGRP